MSVPFLVLESVIHITLSVIHSAVIKVTDEPRVPKTSCTASVQFKMKIFSVVNDYDKSLHAGKKKNNYIFKG